MAQHDVWFSSGADMSLTRPNSAAVPVAALPVGRLSAAGQDFDQAHPHKSLSYGGFPNYLKLLFPFSHSSPKEGGGHPYPRRFSATIA